MPKNHRTHAETCSVDLDGDAEAPVLVELTRGDFVESRHRGRVVVVDARGHIVAKWGDSKGAIFPRSSVKSLQALPFVETGAMDAFDLGDEELALACASHTADARHTGLVASWLERIGLSVVDLECGPQTPDDSDAAADLIRAGRAPTELHNCCSGKHAAFLTTARHRGERTKGYVRIEHPVQQRVMGVLERMTGFDLSRTPWGIDGCGIPTFALPLEVIAHAMATLADPGGLPDPKVEAVLRVRRAWAAHPRVIGGAGSVDTAMMEIVSSRVLLKTGAEGVGVAVLPDRALGVAVKIEDGSPRARDVVLAAVLRKIDAFTAEEWERAAAIAKPPILGRAGRAVGEIRSTLGDPDLDLAF